jgi:hypothetical protein
MKTKFLITSLLLIFLISCSSDNDNNSDNGNEAPTEFLPLKNNNYWTYDVDSDLSSTTNPLTRDSIYIANDTLINSITYKKLKTLNSATGFFSSTLRNNGIKIDGSKLLMTGNFNFDFGLTSPISLNVTDFIFFKESGIIGQELSSISGTISQTVQTYPLTIDYTLKSVYNGSQASYLFPNGDDYGDIRKTKIVLNLKITTVQTVSGISFPVTIMNAQDVIVSNQYYSKNVGMIYANTVLNYQLNSIPNVTLPIPSTFNQTQTESIKSFLIN